MGKQRETSLNMMPTPASAGDAPPRRAAADEVEVMDPAYRAVIERRLLRVRSGKFASAAKVADVLTP